MAFREKEIAAFRKAVEKAIQLAEDSSKGLDELIALSLGVEELALGSRALESVELFRGLAAALEDSAADMESW